VTATGFALPRITGRSRSTLSHGPINRDWVSGRCVVDRVPVHVHDLATEGEEFPLGRDISLRLKQHTVLAVPFLRDGKAIGSLTMRRQEMLPFSEKQIALLRTFSAQAVIAIENTRLFEAEQQRTRELSESLEQQTATADVLRVISSSPGELQPVFTAMLANATRLCDGPFGQFISLRGRKPPPRCSTPPELILEIDIGQAAGRCGRARQNRRLVPRRTHGDGKRRVCIAWSFDPAGS
jgi:GAF domain-containing protein